MAVRTGTAVGQHGDLWSAGENKEWNFSRSVNVVIPVVLRIFQVFKEVNVCTSHIFCYIVVVGINCCLSHMLTVKHCFSVRYRRRILKRVDNISQKSIVL